MKVVKSLLIAACTLSTFFAPITSYAIENTFKERADKVAELVDDSKESDKTAEEILQKMEKANEDVESLRMNTYMYFESKGSTGKETSEVGMDASIFYHPDQAVRAAHAWIASLNDGIETEQEILMADTDPLTMYSKENDQDWHSMTDEMEVTEYSLHPDFFKLMDSLYEMGDELGVLETDDYYILTLVNEDIDVMHYFQEHYDLSLEGITQDNMDKTVFLLIDRKTMLCESVQLFMEYDKDLYLSVYVQSEFSDYNDVSEKDLQGLTEEVQAEME